MYTYVRMYVQTEFLLYQNLSLVFIAVITFVPVTINFAAFDDILFSPSLATQV